ncbi:22932_t:CDS:2, partial [Racocetra persica]
DKADDFYAFIWLLIAISMILNVIPVTSNTNSITLIKTTPKHSWNEIVRFNRDYLKFRYENLIRGSDQYALNKLVSAEKRSKSVNLTESEDSIGFYGSVVIGGQKFNVMFDLFSSDLLVPLAPCCISPNKFNESLSKTFRHIGKKFTAFFGLTEADGVLGEDNLLVGGIKSDQIFGLITSENGFFLLAEYDGIFGLGLDSLSQFNTTSPFSKMVKQKAVKNPYFSLHLNGEGDAGTLTLGDIDTTKFTGKLNYHKVSTVKGKYVIWMTNLDDISINAIKGSKLIFDDAGGTYVVPCNTTDKVEYIFSGINYPSNPIFALSGSSFCISSVQYEDFVDDNTFIIGGSFLRDVYSVYNIKDFTIGLAPISK